MHTVRAPKYLSGRRSRGKGWVRAGNAGKICPPPLVTHLLPTAHPWSQVKSIHKQQTTIRQPIECALDLTLTDSLDCHACTHPGPPCRARIRLTTFSVVHPHGVSYNIHRIAITHPHMAGVVFSRAYIVAAITRTDVHEHRIRCRPGGSEVRGRCRHTFRVQTPLVPFVLFGLHK